MHFFIKSIIEQKYYGDREVLERQERRKEKTMARKKVRKGADWFEVSVNESEAEMLLEEDFGDKGMGLWLKLTRLIFKEGDYYLELSPKVKRSIKRGGTSEEEFNEILDDMLELELFDKAAYEKYQILTNTSVQEVFLKVIKKRVRDKRSYLKKQNNDVSESQLSQITEAVYQELWLLDDDLNEDFLRFESINSVTDCRRLSQTVAVCHTREEKRTLENIREEDIREDIKRTDEYSGEEDNGNPDFDNYELSDDAFTNIGLANKYCCNTPELYSHTDNIVNIVRYFYQVREFRKNIPVLAYKEESHIQELCKLISREVVDDDTMQYPLTVDNLPLYKKVIDKYFATDFNVECDYSLDHFLNGNIRLNRLKEVIRELDKEC